jgi:NitT/TauT family transport system substrate-binding protein
MKYLGIFWAILPLLAILTFGGCWRNDSRSPNAEVSKVLQEVTICQYGDLLIYLPLYIAQEKGFFAEEGLAVRFINGGGDDKTYAAVSSGNAQFGVSDPTFTAIAREKGQPGVVVGTIVSGATYWGVTWDEKIKPVESLEELKGLRIATYESPSTNYALMAKTLKENSSKVGGAKIVEGAYGTLLAMLKANRADIAMELEPVASTAVKEGAHIVFSYPEMYGEFMLTGLYVLESYRDKKPEIVQGAVTALEKAMRFAHSDVQGAIAIAEKKFPEISSDVIRTAVERMVKEKTIPEHVTMSEKGWQNAVNVRLELGDLKDAAAAVSTLDHRFSKKAVNTEVGSVSK